MKCPRVNSISRDRGSAPAAWLLHFQSNRIGTCPVAWSIRTVVVPVGSAGRASPLVVWQVPRADHGILAGLLPSACLATISLSHPACPCLPLLPRPLRLQTVTLPCCIPLVIQDSGWQFSLSRFLTVKYSKSWMLIGGNSANIRVGADGILI